MRHAEIKWLIKVILGAGFRARDCSQTNCSVPGNILVQLVGWSQGKDTAPMRPPSSIPHINCWPGKMPNSGTLPALARQPTGPGGITWSFVYPKEQSYCSCYLFLLAAGSQQTHLPAHPCTCFTLNFLVKEGSVDTNSSRLFVPFKPRLSIAAIQALPDWKPVVV